MVPRTFPSTVNSTTGRRQMVVFFLSSATGLQRWKDYIPVKFVLDDTPTEASYNNDGYIAIDELSSTSGKQEWLDYIPVFLDNSATDAWEVDSNGFIQVGTSGFGGVPNSLFASGEQGAWYDPSDSTTLFQDAAGTTPVTAVEQPVSLMLDKSKGLALGSERKADFVTGIVGTATAATYNTTTGEGSITRVDLSNQSFVTLGSLSSGFYKTTISCQTGSIIIRAGAVTGIQQAALSAGQTLDVYVNTVNRISISHTTSAGSSTFTVVSVRELPGNHAYTPSSATASRPVLSSRYNLLTKTEQFDDAAWGKTFAGVASAPTVTANYAANPIDSTVTADRVQFALNGGTATADISQLRQTVSTASTVTHTFSIWVRSTDGVSTYTMLIFGSPAAAQSITVTGTWTQITITGSGSNVNYSLTLRGGQTPANSDSADVLFWGASLTVTNDGVGIPSYQRVNTSTDYDSDPAKFPRYLRFDGSDDYMLTNSVDFSTVTSDGAARRNLLTFPTAFDNAAWTKSNSTITANTIVAPDGTTTADLLTATNGADATCNQSVSGVNAVGQVFTFTFYARCASGTVTLPVLGDDQSGRFWSNPNTNKVTVTTTWQRFTVTGTAPASSGPNVRVGFGGFSSWLTGDAVYIWGAQLEVGSTATAFQNIGTDKMTVWAGVRKLSDAAQGVVTELSATIASNNGTFLLAAPDSASATYGFDSKGTNQADAVSGALYPAPITNVITGISDISGDSVKLRVNNIEIDTGPDDQGTGNYGNYPLYIGRRGGTSLPFNGRIFSLIIRGAATTSATLTATETYVEVKTLGRAFENVYSDEVTTRDGDLITTAGGEQIYMSVNYQ